MVPGSARAGAIRMKATEDIWTEYHDKLSVFLRTRVANDVAEDILQDVFVKIHSRIDSLKENTKLESGN